MSSKYHSDGYVRLGAIGFRSFCSTGTLIHILNICTILIGGDIDLLQAHNPPKTGRRPYRELLKKSDSCLVRYAIHGCLGPTVSPFNAWIRKTYQRVR